MGLYRAGGLARYELGLLFWHWTPSKFARFCSQRRVEGTEAVWPRGEVLGAACEPWQLLVDLIDSEANLTVPGKRCGKHDLLQHAKIDFSVCLDNRLPVEEFGRM